MTSRTVRYCWTPVGIFFAAYHLFLAVTLPIYFSRATPSLGVVIAAVTLYVLGGQSIGVYHRCYSHKGYRLNRALEYFFVFFGTLAVQGSVLAWSHDHRKHHKFTDKNDDPYTITKGFWYAHILWLYDPKNFKRDYAKYVPDLLKDPLLRFQDKHSNVLSLAGNVVVCGLIGVVCGDLLGAFFIAGWLRIFLLHHFTFFVNSVAHVWGSRTYASELSAVDNTILSFFTFGEGYHNYHHAFSNDYRNGIRWWHFDPNKWMIWIFAKLGLASDLRSHDSPHVYARLFAEDRRILLEHVEKLRDAGAEWRAQQVQHIEERYAAIKARIGELRELIAQWRELKRADWRKRAELRATRKRLREERRGLRRDISSWNMLCKVVLNT